MGRNYQLVYQWRGKCGNYRDSGVSKNMITKNFVNEFEYWFLKQKDVFLEFN